MTFVLEYEYQDKIHNLRIEAESWDEAEDHVEAILDTLELSGQLVHEEFVEDNHPVIGFFKEEDAV